MTPLELPWPTREEYDLAIKDWKNTIIDEDIRLGTLALNKRGGIFRPGGANHYVCIYKIGSWIIRCFCIEMSNQPPFVIKDQPPHDIKDRYKAIDSFCRNNSSKVSALIEVTYIEKGIRVGKLTLPIIKMPFLKLPRLGDYIAKNYLESWKMHQLSNAWFRMISELEAVRMAHGDLDLTNILVEENGSTLLLKLVDYDNVWIPQLRECKQTECGHPSFQHPAFFHINKRPYNAKMDRFSALVMYISLKVLAYQPELYVDWKANEVDKLLLSATNYRDPNSDHILQLLDLGIPEIIPCVEELRKSLGGKNLDFIPDMPRSLKDITGRGSLQLPLPPRTIKMSRNPGVEYPLTHTPILSTKVKPQKPSTHSWVASTATNTPPTLLTEIPITAKPQEVITDTTSIASQVQVSKPRSKATSVLGCIILFLIIFGIVIGILWFTGILNLVILWISQALNQYIHPSTNLKPFIDKFQVFVHPLPIHQKPILSILYERMY